MSTLRNKMILQMQIKGFSNRTVNTYTKCILALAVHYNTSPDQLTTEQIREYIHYRLTKIGVSKSWMNQFVSALKILFCDVLKREWKQLDFPHARPEKKLPVVLAKEEVRKLIDITNNLKHRALLALTYSAGLRLSEVCNLKITDIDSKRMMIRIVQSKGFKDRYCVLSPVALHLLREYWKRYRASLWLFETKPKQPLACRTVQQIFKNSLRKAGIKKEVGIHSLRHSFATHLLEQGVSLPIIQELLGHKSLKTTSVYLHVQQYSIDAIRSPLDTLSV